MVIVQPSAITKTEYYGKGKDREDTSKRWWLEDESSMYSSVFAVANNILQGNAARRRMNYFFASMYNDIGGSGLYSRHINVYYNQTALDSGPQMNSGITTNVMQSAIDTACAMISKNKPKPQFLTDGATKFSTKIRGKKLTKYVEGVFSETKMYQKMQKVFLDACIYGTGALKLYEEDNEIKADNLFIEEVLVDDLEGMHEKPTQILQRKFLPRDVLIGLFPDKKEQILAAHDVVAGATIYSTADVIPVIESWHLRSSKKSKDGVHAISIDNATLASEEYKKDYYPIIFYRWAHQTLGFWGRGICHETWKMQRELDYLNQLFQRAARLLSGAVLAVESGSNIPENHLTSNKLFKIIEYTVTKPDYLLPPIIQQELYARAELLEDRIYKISGVSQAQATGTKPGELVSKVAIREVADQATGRFELQAQDYEEKFLDLADMIVDMSCDLKDPSILTSDRNGAKMMDFKEAVVERKEYKLQLFPISGLPSTPAGRLDQMMDYAQAGYFTREQVLDVSNFPISKIQLIWKLLQSISLKIFYPISKKREKKAINLLVSIWI